MLNIVIFGAPGSGKGTQSENLIEKYNLAHISTGDVLRAETASGSELGQLADSYMCKGQLIPDELMVEILASVFDQKINSGNFKGVIFDGFPRTLPQGEALDKMLEERKQEITAVINLEVPEEELIDRLIKRGQQTGRNDDNHDVIKARLDVYNNQTAPLKDFYEEKGKLHTVHGHDTVNEVFCNIVKVIEKVK